MLWVTFMVFGNKGDTSTLDSLSKTVHLVREPISVFGLCSVSH